MPKMILGIDIDGVLADIHIIACEQGRIRYGVCVEPSDIVCWNHVVRPGLGFSKLVYDVLDQPEVVRRLPVVPGALAGMAEVMGIARELDVEVCIITTRPDSLIEASTAWVHEHFGPLDVIVTPDKAKYCDLLIDDYPVNIEAMWKADKEGILYDRPWNQGFVCGWRATWPMGEEVRAALGGL